MRERTRMVGGIGGCGRGHDCCQFLPLKKQKVTLDSVRDQGIMINNNDKILGLHGNIKTCFLYEVDDYREKRKYLPHIRQIVKIGSQEARVTGLDILNQKVKVIMENGNFETYPVSEVQFEGKREMPEEPPLNFEEVKMNSEGVGI
jgi:cell fate regulator YaaT (PSP1 superfamily)